MDACPREFFGGGKSKKLVVAQMFCWNTTTGQSLAGTSSLRSSTRATLPSVLVGVQSLCQVCTQSCWVALSGRDTNNITSFATRPLSFFFVPTWDGTTRKLSSSCAAARSCLLFCQRTTVTDHARYADPASFSSLAVALWR